MRVIVHPGYARRRTKAYYMYTVHCFQGLKTASFELKTSPAAPARGIHPRLDGRQQPLGQRHVHALLDPQIRRVVQHAVQPLRRSAAERGRRSEGEARLSAER